MFNQPTYTIKTSHYRKKDENGNANGEYVFQFNFAVPATATLDFSNLSKDKQDELKQRLLLAEKNGDDVQIIGTQSTKNYKTGAVYILFVSDVIYTQRAKQNA